MTNFNWTCRYCNFPQVATLQNTFSSKQELKIGKSKYGRCGYSVHAIACQNVDCKEIDLEFTFSTANNIYFNEFHVMNVIQSYKLRPESSAKPQPDFIPAPILSDYYEACRILELSPKASATLSRRCLQGMIRDFCKITKKTLAEEIKAVATSLENGIAPQGVTAETIEAIDHVRQIGNIGAHMEKDINLIIEIDPEEAKTLIELIEMLFDDWYVARESRNQRLERLKGIAGDKQAKKQLAPPKTTA